jgi:hypothetical protein
MLGEGELCAFSDRLTSVYLAVQSMLLPSGEVHRGSQLPASQPARAANHFEPPFGTAADTDVAEEQG